MSQKLPLFPLNTVLLPGAKIPLHIFEDRYRRMIERCLEQQSPFGVVGIREAGRADTDPTVSFYEVGTTAQISEHVRFDDGRYYLVGLGQRRFRIQYLVQRLPYAIASVTLLPEESGNGVTEAATELRTLYERYWTVISVATGSEPNPEPLPQDLVELSYWMAQRLQVDLTRKQHWLEADIGTRLREMAILLRSELALFPPNPGNRDSHWHGPGSLN